MAPTLGRSVLKPHNSPSSSWTTDVQKELERQIKDGKLPPRDANTLYMIYFPQRHHNQSWTAPFLARVSAPTTSPPWTARSRRRRTSFTRSSRSVIRGSAFLTFAASHEYAEATTDNVPTPGSNPDFPQAWNDASGFEIGDKCSGSGTLTSTAGSWSVTQYLSEQQARLQHGQLHQPITVPLQGSVIGPKQPGSLIGAGLFFYKSLRKP